MANLEDDGLLSQSPSILNDDTATVGEELASDHIPITPTIRCVVLAASASHHRAHWSKTNVDWDSHSAAVEEATGSIAKNLPSS